jgi:predicted GH43/DUF377 family glycosyl hydrolase
MLSDPQFSIVSVRSGRRSKADETGCDAKALKAKACTISGTRTSMTKTDIMTRSPLILRPDPSRTVIRPFLPEDPAAYAIKDHARAQRIADLILALDKPALHHALQRLTGPLNERHLDVENLLLRRFAAVSDLIDRTGISHEQSLLIGAYFSAEYSFESAALFNPSIVLHPDQSGLPDGTVRFILSLRGIGEGHVSSVTFRTGTWGPGKDVVVDPPSPHGVPPRIEGPEGDADDPVIRLVCKESRSLSETVIFPITPSQRQGIEDLRLVRFVDDDGTVHYRGTYTAFDGTAARSEMLHAKDFRSFEMRPLQGAAADNKGMALFPRRIGGRYMMLGRQDNESIWLLASDDLHSWEGGQKIISPHCDWEFVQMGNCGSPIEIDEGWLVLTHGVGMVRSYCLGACLLDKGDPSKVLARTIQPLLKPSPRERGGYVPNVVYSCGGLVHDRTLLLPYGVADQFATFATVPLDKLLGTMS